MSAHIGSFARYDYVASARNHFDAPALKALGKAFRFIGRRLLRLPDIQHSTFVDPAFSEENAAGLGALARAIRGTGGPRIVFLHGVMPRSGTNYLQSLLALHPDVVTNPFGIREMPLLNVLDEARHFESAFLRSYSGNRSVVRDLEMFSCLVSGFMRRIETAFPAHSVVVLKSPHTRMIGYFPYLFPTEQCAIVLRDGRRTVQSTIDTWPLRFLGRTFADVCREWSYGTQAALDAQVRLGERRCRLIRFEAAVRDPESAIRDLLHFLSLDDSRYPYERIATLPILGSSELSRVNGAVDWKPVERPRGFDPATRPISWPRSRRMIFQAVAGDTQRRAGYG